MNARMEVYFSVGRLECWSHTKQATRIQDKTVSYHTKISNYNQQSQNRLVLHHHYFIHTFGSFPSVVCLPVRKSVLFRGHPNNLGHGMQL